MHLSPLSVPYRVVERGASLVVTAAVLASGASTLFGPGGVPLALAVVGVAVVALVGYEVAHHRRFEYELTAETLDIRSGVLSRRNREIPLRRIQTVDISRNAVQRALGIAAVDFETAGGSETEASLRFVSFEEAKRLQEAVRRLKRGDADGSDEQAGELLFALSNRDLALVGVLSFDFRLPGATLLVLSGGVPVVSSYLPDVGGTGLLAAGLVGLFVLVVLGSWLAGGVAAVLNYYGFRLTRVGDELQYERGLLRRYDGSIPLDKVQSLTVVDDPLKRAVGYASLRIETAGYAPGSRREEGSQAAVPLASRERVLALARDVEPMDEPAFERPPRRVRRRYAARYLLALAVLVGTLYALAAVASLPVAWYAPAVLVPLAPVAAHLKWRHRGRWLGANHVVTRNGVLRRRTKVVPYYRIQTVVDSRTLFQRRWNVATVTADTAGSASLGGDDAAAVDVDAAVADELRETLVDRLRDALAARRATTRADDAGETGRTDENGRLHGEEGGTDGDSG
ncbi:MAG: PH domain-containing protein [Haloplanus sp.]